MSAPHILLIEDDPTETFLAVRTLKKIDPAIQVTALHDGAEFTDYLSSQSTSHVTLALMDLHMPRMSGLAFMKGIRTRDQELSFPIVVFSSSEDPEEVSNAYELGVSGFVTKPNKPSDYREALRNIVNFWVSTNRLT